jgi:exosortase A
MDSTRRNQFGSRACVPEAPFRATVPSGSPVSRRWRILASLAFLCFFAALLAFRETVVAMVTTWYSSRTFSHCFLVFPLSVYLIWRRRKQLAAIDPSPNLWGLFVLGFLSIIWVLGNLGEIRLVEEWAFIGILVGIVWTLLGSAVFQVLDLPLAFLVFAIPFGLVLIGPLQDVTAWFAVHALTISGIPAVLENHVLSVPTATWTVAEACSGVRYLFSSVMLGVIYAWLAYRSRKPRILFLCASLAVPILANGARAYGIVLLAYLTNNRLAADVDHIVYGWVFFTAVQLGLFVVGLRWREVSDLTKSPHRGSAPSGWTSENTETQFAWKMPILAFSLTAILLALTPVLANGLWNRASRNADWSEWPDPPVSVSLPWQATPAFDASWAPDLRGKSRGFVNSYVSGQNRVDLFWALYSGERGFELLNSYNRVANPKLWSLVAEDSERETIDGARVRLHRSLIGSGPVARSVLTWYWVNGEYTGSSARVKFLQVKARLLGSSPLSCVLAISTDSTIDGPSAESVLHDFLAHTDFLVRAAPAISIRAEIGNELRTFRTVHNVSH